MRFVFCDAASGLRCTLLYYIITSLDNRSIPPFVLRYWESRLWCSWRKLILFLAIVSWTMSSRERQVSSMTILLIILIKLSRTSTLGRRYQNKPLLCCCYLDIYDMNLHFLSMKPSITGRIKDWPEALISFWLSVSVCIPGTVEQQLIRRQWMHSSLVAFFILCRWFSQGLRKVSSLQWVEGMSLLDRWRLLLHRKDLKADKNTRFSIFCFPSASVATTAGNVSTSLGDFMSARISHELLSFTSFLSSHSSYIFSFFLIWHRNPGS